MVKYWLRFFRLKVFLVLLFALVCGLSVNSYAGPEEEVSIKENGGTYSSLSEIYVARIAKKTEKDRKLGGSILLGCGVGLVALSPVMPDLILGEEEKEYKDDVTALTALTGVLFGGLGILTRKILSIPEKDNEKANITTKGG